MLAQLCYYQPLNTTYYKPRVEFSNISAWSNLTLPIWKVVRMYKPKKIRKNNSTISMATNCSKIARKHYRPVLERTYLRIRFKLQVSLICFNRITPREKKKRQKIENKTAIFYFERKQIIPFFLQRTKSSTENHFCCWLSEQKFRRKNCLRTEKKYTHSKTNTFLAQIL